MANLMLTFAWLEPWHESFPCSMLKEKKNGLLLLFKNYLLYGNYLLNGLLTMSHRKILVGQQSRYRWVSSDDRVFHTTIHNVISRFNLLVLIFGFLGMETLLICHFLGTERKDGMKQKAVNCR